MKRHVGTDISREEQRSEIHGELRSKANERETIKETKNKYKSTQGKNMSL